MSALRHRSSFSSWSYLMNAEYLDPEPLIRSQVIHPTISEVIAKAFASLEHPEHFAEGRATAGERKG